jgi:hypothetical protein
MRLEVRDAIAEDCAALAKTMRPEDMAEVLASGGFTPLRALVASRKASADTRVLLVDGEVAAMWGVVPLPMDGAGAVWLLTGTAVDRAPTAFLRKCREELGRIRATWALLVNFIDARHAKALRWARWLGFEVGSPEPFGVAGLPFCHVQLSREVVEGPCVRR